MPRLHNIPNKFQHNLKIINNDKNKVLNLNLANNKNFDQFRSVYCFMHYTISNYLTILFVLKHLFIEVKKHLPNNFVLFSIVLAFVLNQIKENVTNVIIKNMSLCAPSWANYIKINLKI